MMQHTQDIAECTLRLTFGKSLVFGFRPPYLAISLASCSISISLADFS